MAAKASQVEVDGRLLRVTNLDKVMYPETGTTKGDVIAYYTAVARWLVPHVAGRPATRKRWVNGVDAHAFFSKNADSGTPDWVRTVTIQHSRDTSRYPIVDDAATLVFLAQLAALEIHVPQWRFSGADEPQHPDRLVLDLDPGEGAGLAECVELALIVKEILDGVGLVSVPVTSGSKGIHVYAGLDGHLTSGEASEFARQLAVALEASYPELVVADMKKTLRDGKVLLDWSQNNGAKTTVSPYSLRGRPQPWVAAPRTWDEIGPGLTQLTYREVLGRLDTMGDPLAVLLGGSGTEGSGTLGSGTGGSDAVPAGQASTVVGDLPTSSVPDRLTTYRAKRDAAATPEPVPAASPVPGGDDTFVIQEHHARRLHHDLRLERHGVLVSWAIPKLTPLVQGVNHLAVHTEDHPMEYATFAGTIPKGEYGAGHMTIWDAGTYTTEKWREDREVIVTLHGRPDGGLGGVPRRYVLIHTAHGDEKNWLVHLMADGADGVPTGAPLVAPRAARSPTSPPIQDPGSSPEHHLPPSDGVGESRLSMADTPGSGAGTPVHGQNSPATPSGGTGPAASPTQTGPAASPTLADLPTIEPMLATAATPGEVSGDDWHYEVKWDGYRGVASIAGGAVSMRSRGGLDFATTYPELGELIGLLDGHAAVLDGEIVALGPDGRSHFELLQNHGRGAASAHYMAFDVLWLDGSSLLDRPYLERRGVLEELLGEGGRHVHVPTTFGTDRELALATSRQLALEGLIAKRPQGTYAPGRRSRTWLKLKNVRHQEAVVVGWKPGSGGRAGTIGSLLLAVNTPDGLSFVGHAGSGFTDRGLAEAQRLLAPLERPTPPLEGVPRPDAKDAHWVEPRLVGEVSFAEWTAAGTLRHPVWRGWRPDSRPDEVVREG